MSVSVARTHEITGHAA